MEPDFDLKAYQPDSPSFAAQDTGIRAQFVTTTGGFPEDSACLGQSITEVVTDRFSAYLQHLSDQLGLPLPQPIKILIYDDPRIPLAGYHQKSEALQQWRVDSEFIHFNAAALKQLGLKPDAALPILNFVGLHEIAHAVDSSLDLKPSNNALKEIISAHSQEIPSFIPQQIDRIMFAQGINGMMHEIFIDGLALNLGKNFQAFSSTALTAEERGHRLAAAYVLTFHGAEFGHGTVLKVGGDPQFGKRLGLIGMIALGEALQSFAQTSDQNKTFVRLDEMLVASRTRLAALPKSPKYATLPDDLCFRMLGAALAAGQNFDFKL